MEEALALVLAYLIGSVPLTWLIFYWRTGKDLRTVPLTSSSLQSGRLRLHGARPS